MLTENPLAGAAADQLAGYGIDFVADFFRVTEAEVDAKIAELSTRQVDLNDATLRSPETLHQIEQILRTDPDLSEGDIRAYLQDYYESYSDQVGYYAERYTG